MVPRAIPTPQHTSNFATDTRSKGQQELASKKESVTDNSTRNAKSENPKSKRKKETVKNTRNDKQKELAGSGETAVTEGHTNEAANHAPRGTCGPGHSAKTEDTATRRRLTSPAELATNWKQFL